MTAIWGRWAILGVLWLALIAGCRTTQPNLKPAEMAEQYNTPPMESRYETASYPKKAFDSPEDPVRRMMDSKVNPGMQGRGGMMPTGGMGGRGY